MRNWDKTIEQSPKDEIVFELPTQPRKTIRLSYIKSVIASLYSLTSRERLYVHITPKFQIVKWYK